MSFDNLGLSPELLGAIKKLGFEKPTQIQEESIPHIMKGRDVIGESATGSGKTLAFGTAIIDKLVPGKGLQALVITPTRELVEQVKKALCLFSSLKKLKIITIYGGVGMGPQIEGLKTADVVVATPGRLLDHLSRRNLDFSKLKILILDEADRMFDMGFIDDVERIISQCPKERQTLFYSATIMPSVKSLAHKHMKNPVMVTAVKMVDPTKLEQVYYDIFKKQKLALLIHLLKEEDSDLVMVFCNTKSTTDFVSANLKANGIDATTIHGGLSQNKREHSLDIFHKGKKNILVCTDVAARGLHIDNVSHVYNYEIPPNPTEYVHRIGRTARAGEEGKVINLISDDDHANFGRLEYEHRDFKIKHLQAPENLDRITTVVPSRRPRGDQRRPAYGNRGGPRGNSHRPKSSNRGGFSRGGRSGGPRKSFGNRRSSGSRPPKRD
jgi:superfamily II DNA/RNA helicase